MKQAHQVLRTRWRICHKAPHITNQSTPHSRWVHCQLPRNGAQAQTNPLRSSRSTACALPAWLSTAAHERSTIPVWLAPVMFNGKFPFPPSRMASNFSLPGISRTGIPGKFPRFGYFPSFRYFPSCGNHVNSRPMENSRFLSAHISDFQSVFCVRKLVL